MASSLSIIIAILFMTFSNISQTDENIQNYFCGTTIIAIRTPNEIIVGADSKMVTVGNNTSDAGAICKITQVDDMFFAHARLIKDTKGILNVPETARQAHKKGESLQAIANRFEKMIVGPLAAILQDIKRDQPEYFQKHIDGHSAVDIAFFRYENDTPLLYVRYFTAKTSTTGKILVETSKLDCPGNCPSGMTYAFLGEYSALNKFLDANPHYSKNGWVPTINRLIEIEAKDKPDFVGLPVDILHLDKSGAKWLQKKAQCPEIKKY